MRLKLLLSVWVAFLFLFSGIGVTTLKADTPPTDPSNETLLAEVKGAITGADGKPLIGATVRVKDTQQGTLTDGEGKYSLNVPDGATTLVVSYVGYQTQEIEIGGRATVDIVMADAVSFLDEVVVTGYGTLKGKEVTGSITSVKAKDFNVGNISDPSQLLQGKVAGLVVARPGANPNGGFSIRLRGLSTIGASTEPLVVIDGVLGGDFNSIDPSRYCFY